MSKSPSPQRYVNLPSRPARAPPPSICARALMIVECPYACIVLGCACGVMYMSSIVYNYSFPKLINTSCHFIFLWLSGVHLMSLRACYPKRNVKMNFIHFDSVLPPLVSIVSVMLSLFHQCLLLSDDMTSSYIHLSVTKPITFDQRNQ